MGWDEKGEGHGRGWVRYRQLRAWALGSGSPMGNENHGGGRAFTCIAIVDCIVAWSGLSTRRRCGGTSPGSRRLGENPKGNCDRM